MSSPDKVSVIVFAVSVHYLCANSKAFLPKGETHNTQIHKPSILDINIERKLTVCGKAVIKGEIEKERNEEREMFSDSSRWDICSSVA